MPEAADCSFGGSGSKTPVQEKFEKSMEKDFWSSSKTFWQTVFLRKGKWTLSQAVLGLGGELLTQTEDFVERWKEHFDDLLNLPTMPSLEEAKSEDLEENESH